eukprot:3283331-Amphidinium_carterae.1
MKGVCLHRRIVEGGSSHIWAARIEMGRAANIREWQRLEYCGYNHTLHEYAIYDDREQRVGALVDKGFPFTIKLNMYRFGSFYVRDVCL